MPELSPKKKETTCLSYSQWSSIQSVKISAIMFINDASKNSNQSFKGNNDSTGKGWHIVALSSSIENIVAEKKHL